MFDIRDKLVSKSACSFIDKFLSQRFYLVFEICLEKLFFLDDFCFNVKCSSIWSVFT